MAEKYENEEPGPRGNDWEVVSLTASTYAAAPAPELVGIIGAENSNSVDENKDQAPDLMVRSRHFVFPPPQHENLPLELTTKSNEIHSVHGGENEGVRSETKEPENISIKSLGMSNVYPGIEIFDVKGNILPVDGEGLQGLMDQQDSLYSSATLSSIHNESNVGESVSEEGCVSTDIVCPSDQEDDSGISNFPEYSDTDHDGCNLPCEAWWKRKAVSLYAHAKDANAFWSIFIAAAVMGIVILGHRWQQERLKWQHGLISQEVFVSVFKF